MKKIDLNKCLCIYNEGQIDAVYEVKHNKKYIKAAIEDYGYFTDDDFEEREDGIKSIFGVAKEILNNGSFFDEAGDREFIIDGSCCPGMN